MKASVSRVELARWAIASVLVGAFAVFDHSENEKTRLAIAKADEAARDAETAANDAESAAKAAEQTADDAKLAAEAAESAAQEAQSVVENR